MEVKKKMYNNNNWPGRGDRVFYTVGPASERPRNGEGAIAARGRRDGDGERGRVAAAGRSVGRSVVGVPCLPYHRGRGGCGSCPATRAVGGRFGAADPAKNVGGITTCARVCVRACLRPRARLCVCVCACVRCAVRDRGKRACAVEGGNGRVIRVIYVRRYPLYHIYIHYTHYIFYIRIYIYIYTHTSVLIYII